MINVQLNTFYDPNQTHRILQMHDHFLFDNHICIVTEILGCVPVSDTQHGPVPSDEGKPQ